MANRPVQVGEPAPWFSAFADKVSDKLIFDELAGRHLILFFYRTPLRTDVTETLARVDGLDQMFEQEKTIFLAINSHSTHNTTRPFLSGRRHIWDQTGELGALYGISERSEAAIAFVTNPALQITHKIELKDPAQFVAELQAAVRDHESAQLSGRRAPAIDVADVFDSSLCHRLTEFFDASDARETGFAAKIGGEVISQIDHRIKRRSDCAITDEKLRHEIKDHFERRLLVMVHRAFQFRTTWLERYIVGRYDAAIGGHFRPHRDNASPHSAHRGFAVTINLNRNYEGGDLRFPEFGPQTYRPAPGSALVFSCSLLHEVTPVTSGRRYAFLSFLCTDQPPTTVTKGIIGWQRVVLAASLQLLAASSANIKIFHDASSATCNDRANDLQSVFAQASGWNVERAALMNPQPRPRVGLAVCVADATDLHPTAKIVIDALAKAGIDHECLVRQWPGTELGLLVTDPIAHS